MTDWISTSYAYEVQSDAMPSANPELDLTSLPIVTRPVARLTQLFSGLVLYGASTALTVRAQLGLNPWNVLHEGLTMLLGWSFGSVTALTSLFVLLMWLPLRQRPGIGTVANIIVIAVAVDATLALVPPVTGLRWQLFTLTAAVTLNGLATATYVGARLGPGPRDGLMTGLHARTQGSIRVVRTGIEAAVLCVGWLLGGTAGLGTVIYGLAIGPLTQLFLPLVAVRTDDENWCYARDRGC